jgi:hypothetical protein
MVSSRQGTNNFDTQRRVCRLNQESPEPANSQESVTTCAYYPIVLLLAAVIANYKSIKSCEVPLDGMTVLLGRNGAGKTNLIEALAAHDLALRSGLAETRRLARPEQTRVGLVVRFQSTTNGNGPDSELLRELITAHWRSGSDPTDLAIETGAYCGASWWLYSKADLFDENVQGSLGDCLAVIKASILFGVETKHLALAAKLVDELFEEPVLIVQEDFAVELSCTPDNPTLLEAMDLDLSDTDESAFYHLVMVARSGVLKQQWKPLIRLSTGRSPDTPTRAAGFDWTVNRFGGITWLSGDVETLEAHLDSMLPQIHDKIFHSAPLLNGVPYDWECEICMDADHGARVDPSIYEEIGFFPESKTWLEEQGGWYRIRPSLRAALSVVEEEANRSLPQFLAEIGVVQLTFSPTTEWGGDHFARCEVRFREFDTVPSPPNGAEKERCTEALSASQDPVTGLRISQLGQGFQRWIAIAVRISINRCADGEVHLAEPIDFIELNDQQSIGLSYQAESLRPRILLIDEPEQHLHISAQHQAALWCMSQARTNHAVLVASHSPAFAALPPERATTCMVRKVNRQTIVQPLEPIHGPDAVARAQELGFELGLGRTALAQFTRAVLVVEGEWDRRLLYAFFGHDLAAQRVLVVPLQGSDELLALADAAVIPALGVPVVALLDEVRAVSVADIATLTPPLSKAERCLLDLSAALGANLSLVRYEDPDIICALPEAAVHRAFPSADFPGWSELLNNWSQARQRGETPDSFKKWALGRMGLPKKDRYPPTFFRSVLAATTPADRPGRRLEQAVKQALALVDAPV